MPIWKLLSYTNWLLIAIWAALVLYYLTLPNGPTDAAGQGLESALKGACVFVLLGLIGLNWLPYPLTKVVTLVLVILILLLARYITTN